MCNYVTEPRWRITRQMGFSVALLLAVMVVLSLTACSREAKKKLPSKTPSSTLKAVKKVGALRVGFSTTKPQFNKGAVVPLELVVVNTSKDRVELRFSSAQRYDFSITDSRGRQVWKWSHGRMFAQAFETKTLPPGKSISFAADWRQETNRKEPAPIGTYYLRAEFDAVDYFTKVGPIRINIINR